MSYEPRKNVAFEKLMAHCSLLKAHS